MVCGHPGDDDGAINWAEIAACLRPPCSAIGRERGSADANPDVDELLRWTYGARHCRGCWEHPRPRPDVPRWRRWAARAFMVPAALVVMAAGPITVDLASGRGVSLGRLLSFYGFAIYGLAFVGAFTIVALTLFWVALRIRGEP